MSELFTEPQLEAMLREAVEAAGGAKKWCRKNKVFGHDYSLHMITDGRAATLRDVLPVLGFRAVVRYEKIDPK